MKTEINVELLAKAVNQIIQHPETFDQGAWHSSCGTKHCIAGWCQILGGKPANEENARDDAKKLVNLSERDAEWLFSPNLSLFQIYDFAKAAIAGESNFDRDGFDRDGFDSYGFDSYGLDRNGIDRNGKTLPLLKPKRQKQKEKKK